MGQEGSLTFHKYFERGLHSLVRLPRLYKRGVQLAVDSLLLAASFTLAMALRLDSFDFITNPEPWIAFAIVLPITLLIFVRTGFYRALVRYISSRAFTTMFWGILSSAVLLFATSQLLGLFVPRSVPGIYAMLALLTVGGVRFALRDLIFRQQKRGRIPVLIYGANDQGESLIHVLGHGRDYVPIGFVDDSPHLHGTDIGGLRVYAPDQLPELVAASGISLVLLALPQASRDHRNQIITQLATLSVKVQTIPEIEDIVSGRASLSEFREVPPEDLLGRDPVPPKPDLMGQAIAGKVVMVSGAGGSIGSELCRQILSYSPKTLLLYDISELALYSLDHELQAMAAQMKAPPHIIPMIGSVQTPRRVASVISRFGVQTIYHAAAYKHVPLVEQNMIEGLRNNVFGTQTLLEAAIAHKVEAFTMISTDKAVRPTNVMGASKRLAELICQAQAAQQSTTQISMVRFGNVLGSSGSVIPRFRAQIASGGPVTVTHPEITRYFMSIPEAAQLVIQAGAMAKGGDVFVLDMGQPVKIVDLADRMVRLSGMTPFIRGTENTGGDIEICFTQLRPGEKLYEELLIAEDAHVTAHPRIKTATEAFLPQNALEQVLERLQVACLEQDIPTLRQLLQDAPLQYTPDPNLVDLAWQANNTPRGPAAQS